ncbi:hypothetical protein M3Y99_00367400 [Aphelenchoides fujianensis]|nr:hypothetical protein M3Y99_00367400 [Aphelenchoides fujianensis]
MKVETCVYSGYKIYPGHGKRQVRADGKEKTKAPSNQKAAKPAKTVAGAKPRLLLLLYLFITDLAEQPVPLVELGADHVASLMHKAADGRCPFVISPLVPLQLHELQKENDYANDRHRQLSYVDHGLNFSMINRKLRRYFAENFGGSVEGVLVKLKEQLSFSRFFDVMFESSNKEMNNMGTVQMFILYFFSIMAVGSLWNFRPEHEKPMATMNVFCKTRFLIVGYAIGSPSGALHPPADTQETAFFLIWVVMIGSVHFVSSALLLFLKKRCAFQTANFRIFRGGFVAYAAMSAVFTSVLLSYVVLPRTPDILPLYSIMLVADALALIMCLGRDICRALLFGDEQNEILRFSGTVLSAAADFFECVFISAALYHGFFVRRRLLLIALWSYNAFVINRLLTFDYPLVQQRPAITS